jgi:hypothetical protein
LTRIRGHSGSPRRPRSCAAIHPRAQPASRLPFSDCGAAAHRPRRTRAGAHGHARLVDLQPLLRCDFPAVPPDSRGVRQGAHLRGNSVPTPAARAAPIALHATGARLSAHWATGTTLALCEVVAAGGDRGRAAGVGRRGRFWNGSARRVESGRTSGGPRRAAREATPRGRWCRRARGAAGAAPWSGSRGGGASQWKPRGRLRRMERAGRGQAGGPLSAPCSFRRLTERSTHYTVPGERSIRRKPVSVKWRSSEAPWPSEFSQHQPSRARPS